MRITEKECKSLFPRQIKGAKKVREAWKKYNKGLISYNQLNTIYFFYVK